MADWKEVFEREDDMATYRIEDGWLTATYKTEAREDGSGISLGWVPDPRFADAVIDGYWKWRRKKGEFPKLNYEGEVAALGVD